MKISWPKIYAGFASNVDSPWTGMLPYLGEKLALTPESLSSFGVGFAPIVTFKQGKVSSNWWVIPERDAEGRIVGLSLRSESGAKVMYPGSKHGLVYAVRPGYKTGSKDYAPGRHNWVRTMDAGKLCPVCGKPDGCLLSAENVADPQAVMCIREKKGAARPGDLDSGGWLHIRKAEGHLEKGGPLAPSELPIVLVEGMTDAAAARDLGFESVGRPSNLAGLTYLKQLVKGRHCFIVGENDIKADGRHPGKEGVEAVFETLKNVCKLTKFFPPQGVKDLREWKNEHGLTKETLIEYAAQHGSDRGDDRTLDSAEPVRIALRWINEEQTQDGVPILRKYENEWYRFDGKCYKPVKEEAYIRHSLYNWLFDRSYRKENHDGSITLEAYEPDKSRITNIIDALTIACPLQAEPPCWLDAREGPSSKNLLAFPNGVLDVNAFLFDGTTTLMPLSPHYFTFNALPYDYDPNAECPLFLAFLKQIFPDDPKKSLLAQEWLGYNLLPDTTQQKLMLFNGTSGSGKTTLLHAFEATLGQDQVCNPTLEGMGETYGLAQFIGRLSAFINDAELGPRSNKTVILNRIKELTGSVDPRLEVRRMHIAATKLPLFARITIACNDLPDLNDTGAALPRRTLALHFTEKFDTKEKMPDRNLPIKLAQEAPGILNWALKGLERLRRTGQFTIPASSEELAKKFATNASNIMQFVGECCEVGSHATMAEDVGFAAWRNWSREHGFSGGMRLKFSHNLSMAVSSVRFVTDVIDGKKVSGFTGIGLTQEAKDRYLGR